MEEKKKNKKIYIIIIAIFVLLLGFNFFSYFKTALLLSDRYIPVVYGKNPVNNKSDYIDLSKGVIILSGWGTWCGACIAELPELNKIARKHTVYGIIKPPFKYETYRQLLPKFKSIILAEDIFEELYISIFPTSILMQDGVVKEVHLGIMTEEFADKWVKSLEE